MSPAVVHHILASLAPDIAYRIAHHADLDHEPPVSVLEVTDGTVDLGGLVMVRCAPTDHKPVEPSIGYRFDHDGAAVVVAGDTVPAEAAQTAQRAGMDTLVLTHYVPAFPSGEGEDWRQLAAAQFDGMVELGDDLHRVDVHPSGTLTTTTTTHGDP